MALSNAQFGGLPRYCAVEEPGLLLLLSIIDFALFSSSPIHLWYRTLVFCPFFAIRINLLILPHTVRKYTEAAASAAMISG